MIVVIDQPIPDYEEGKFVQYDGKDMTYRTAIVSALNTAFASDENMKADDKGFLYSLSVRLFGKDPIELNHKECSTIQERVNQAWNPLIYGRVYDLLNKKDDQTPKQDAKVE